MRNGSSWLVSVRRFLVQRRGSAAVEFSLVGGATILLLLGAMQVGLYFYTSASLENATVRASRQIMLGTTGGSGMTAAQFRTNVICPLLPAAMSCSNVITNIRTVTQGTAPGGFYQFVNANASGILLPAMDNTQTSFCTGATSSVIYAQVYYAMPIIVPAVLGSIATTWNGRSVFFVASYAAFRNEPFQGSAGAC